MRRTLRVLSPFARTGSRNALKGGGRDRQQKIPNNPNEEDVAGRRLVNFYKYYKRAEPAKLKQASKVKKVFIIL